MDSRNLKTHSLRMEPMVLLHMQVPVADVDRIMEAVVKIIPLTMGNYDSNAYQTGEGIERYRPLEGAAAGPEQIFGNGRALSKSVSNCRMISP